jgi:hypothetical protein
MPIDLLACSLITLVPLLLLWLQCKSVEKEAAKLLVEFRERYYRAEHERDHAREVARLMLSFLDSHPDPSLYKDAIARWPWLAVTQVEVEE